MTDHLILVVDDREDVREALCLNLENNGYTVRQASDGFEALRLFADEPPWAVITDYSMPGMDGQELTDQLKEISPEAPVIIVSSSPVEGPTRADAVILKDRMDQILGTLSRFETPSTT